MTSPDPWYYLDGSTVRGPCAAAALQVLIERGTLPPGVLVAQADWPQWVPAGVAFAESTPEWRPPPPSSAGPRVAASPMVPPHQGAEGFDVWRRRLQRLAGTADLEGFSLRSMFSEVFRRRTDDELDEYFIVGTARTTPPIEEVNIGWPRPWFFGRVLLFVGAVYLAFSFATTAFKNANLIPGLIMMGSLAVPLATVFLFFELNTPRNVALPRVLTLFCAGGIASVIVSLIGYDISALGWLGDMQAGIIEEIGKLVAVALLMRTVRYPYILNGLLFGAAVGAGFAAFESAGYAFRALLANLNIDDMTSLIRLRAFLTPFGHVAWTAIAAGALWRVKGNQPLDPRMFVNQQFLRTFSIPVVLHMVWDAPLPVPFFAVQFVIGLVGWYVVFGLVQEGLKEVKAEQIRALAHGVRAATMDPA
jgi:RsiW-degrading membrane proteinase PrsW (M82 family)